MAPTFTVSRREREALHWLLIRRLFILGQDPPELARKEGSSLTHLAMEFGEDLWLMSDLGWEPERRDASFVLTMPHESLLRTFKRLRRDARRGPSEERHHLEPEEETDEERRAYFHRGVVICELLLDRLAPVCPEAAVPAELSICPAIENGEELRPWRPVTDWYILTAAERAECHEQAEEVRVDVLTEHLGFKPGPETNALLFPQLEDLRRAGLLSSTEKQGKTFWSVTDVGRGKLENLREADESIDLPESPQHRAWRLARVKAAVRIDGLKDELEEAVEAADRIHYTPPLRSKELFELSERLRSSSWRFASATYCLTEWPEPDDERPDVDDHPGPSPGRRTTSAWDQPLAEQGGTP